VVDILSLYNIIGIVYKDYDYDLEQPVLPAPAQVHPRLSQQPTLSNRLTAPATTTLYQPSYLTANAHVNNVIHSPPLFDMSNNQHSTVMTTAQLVEIRTRPVNDRIIAVFMDIDQLGHYTNNAWFQNLEKRQYYNFFREIYNIWRFRAQLSYIVKSRICSYDPTAVFQVINYEEMTIDVLREGCLKIIENMVYMGVDTDHRNLGAFQILTALTIVSIPARQAMPWLYESIM
jgi:hypothetical protein